MEAREILERIEQLWPFNEDRYPGHDARNEQERRCFAISHIAKHLAKALRVCGDQQHLQASLGHLQFRETLFKLIFSASRLVLLSCSQERVLPVYEEWKRDEVKESTDHHFGVARSGTAFKWCMDTLNDQVLKLFGLTEPGDHGDPLPCKEIGDCSFQILSVSLRIATIFRYPWEELAEILSRESASGQLSAA